MNSTETPGGSGIPAGWYDDPSGQGLRWWDGEQWTEHVHTAESAAAATGGGGEGEREAPPPQLVKLRESIQVRGARGVGMVLGGLVLAIVVVALLLSGGSDSSGKGGGPATAPPTAAKPAVTRQIKALHRQLNGAHLPKALKRRLAKQLRALEAKAGTISKTGKGSGGAKGGKSSAGGKESAGAKSSATDKASAGAKSANTAKGGGDPAKPKKKAPGEEGN